MKVLIVDDEAFARRTLRRLLSTREVEVFEAQEGGEGLLQYEKLRPEVILVDIMMNKGLGGEWLIQRLLETFPGCNIIVCSGKPQSELLKYQLMGVRACLSKPIKCDELWNEIDKIGIM